MIIHITQNGIKYITQIDLLALTNGIFLKIGVLKLKYIIVYKKYVLVLYAFNNMLLLTLNSLFVIKSGPYSMRYTHKCVGTICKSNMLCFEQLE